MLWEAPRVFVWLYLQAIAEISMRSSSIMHVLIVLAR